MSARGVSLLHRAIVLGGATCTTVAVLVAQPAAARLDSAAMVSATVGTLLASASAGDSIAKLRTVSPALHAKLGEMRMRLARATLHPLPLQSVATGRATFGVVLRRNGVTPNDVELAALDTLARLMEEEFSAVLRPLIGRDRTTQLLTPVDAFNAALRRQSVAASREKLQRFERKYGPGAPVRNLAEVGLNYLAQWAPGFAPNAEGWPSRAELIASYVPTYLIVPSGDVKAGAATVAEVGARFYLWKEGWGRRLLRPGYVSFGAVLAGERDGAMQSPFAGASRFGGFVGWGNAKVAVIGGRNARVLVTRQVQLVPWVF